EREELERYRKGWACDPPTQRRGGEVDARIEVNARRLPHEQPDDDERHHHGRRGAGEGERERDREIVALAEAMSSGRRCKAWGRDGSRQAAQRSRQAAQRRRRPAPSGALKDRPRW